MARTKEDNAALKKELANTGFFDCDKVELKRDVAKNVTGFGDVVRSPKAIHNETIQAFNEQQHNHGYLLRKKGVDYELAECIVGRSGKDTFTRMMYVEKEVKKTNKTEK